MKKMESNQTQEVEAGDQEEFVLLDIDTACGQARVSPGTPYVLSGLDTMNPVLTIGDGTKLIGEYHETVGTCYVFSEKEGANVIQQSETGPSETNLIKDTCLFDPNQHRKQIKTMASLHKVLKFRLATESELQAAAKNP